jgi:hypothetical protein
MELRDKALRIIEASTSDSTMESLWLHPPKSKAVVLLVDKLTAIYRHAHVAQNPSCIKYHDSWVKEVNDVYDNLHKAGVF